MPDRESITGSGRNVEYTHKKQSGGAGQYGRVIINVLAAQRGEGYEFVDKIFGGAIDQSFRPSVDKGIRAQMVHGVLAGYPNELATIATLAVAAKMGKLGFVFLFQGLSLLLLIFCAGQWLARKAGLVKD